jgi:hypothetical protein
MATKADFTESEWQVLQWAVADTMMYLSMADPGFWDAFKEATGAAKFVAAQQTGADNLLVRDLAAGIRTKKDATLSDNPTELAAAVTARLSEASALIAEKAPDDLSAFKEFVIGLAQATAEAVEGVADSEAGAIDKIRAALG